jgi:hypothetical protein
VIHKYLRVLKIRDKMDWFCGMYCVVGVDKIFEISALFGAFAVFFYFSIKMSSIKII